MLFDRVLGFFSRRSVAPEPLLALPAPSDAAYYRAEIAECEARLDALREEGACSAEIENTRFALEFARENLAAVHDEQAEAWRGRGNVN